MCLNVLRRLQITIKSTILSTIIKCYSIIELNKLARTITSIDPKTKTVMSETKKIVYLEQFFEIIYDIHCIKRMHQGITKVYEQVCERYFGVPRIAVELFREYCYICDLNKKQMSQPRLTPIISNAIFDRVQLDLIDMRNSPDGDFNWIAHMEDHNSQFHVLWASKQKEGKKYFLSFFLSCYCHKDGRCKCWKNQSKCTSHCHSKQAKSGNKKCKWI